jgi:hypothetical protein
VNPGHALKRADCPLQPNRHHAQLGRKEIWQIAEVQV